MKNITIITEANIEMGMGHVKRMLCLAQSLRKDCRITFLTQSGNIVRQYIQDYGFDVLPVHHSYEKTLSFNLISLYGY